MARLAVVFVLALGSVAAAGDANRLAWLDGNNPYYPSRTFPKLTTPQWVGEEGVEAVVVLAIDDMREPAKYEAFLRPILIRLKAIDGRAPLSIMTCRVDPQNQQLQQWLAEGLSLEIHTIDHPCPLLKDSGFGKARKTCDDCIDLLNAVPGNRPIAFRMPCCDSLNTLSPRFFSEIFNSVTARGNFLELDSSVFNILTSNDVEVPAELVVDADGRDKFRKYVPFKSFANTIEDYPYPYVINRLCWEFPCVVPTDWSAQHLQKPNNPDTVRDLKSALDAVVKKQGVYNLVFHPHGWIKNDQVVEIIDHAVRKHGKSVKFLSFREALQRLNRFLLADNPLRSRDGQDNGVRVLDVNNDGFQDVVIGSEADRKTRIWDPKSLSWREIPFPTPLIQVDRFNKHHDAGVHFGVLRPDGQATALVSTQSTRRAWTFDGAEWQPDLPLRELLRRDEDVLHTNILGKDRGGRLRDIDGDGVCELLVSSPTAQAIHRLNPKTNAWELLPIKLPEGTQIADARGHDAGLRFVDLDQDGHDDVLFSNEARYSIHLWESLEKGWGRQLLAGERGRKPPEQELPMISREGTDNGAWFHSRHLWVQNEDTARLPDLVDRRSYIDLLAAAEFDVPPKDARAALNTFQLRPGFAIEQVAAEPLTMDPVAFDWGPDGKLWVVEMADYPLGIDGQPGGRVRFLEDKDGDGRYDKSTLFLENVPYPNGVKAWRKGVLVSAAPDIFYAEDTNGDGKADAREVLYTGFAEGNQQHRVNGFEWGLDNWLYLANGDSGGKVKSLKTGQELSISGRDVRIRPSDGGIEPATGQTQFGRHRDDWGHWFGNNNSNPMFQLVLPDEYLRRNPRFAAPDPRVNVSVTPGPSPVFPISRTLTRFNDFDRANRFTSACSTIVYRDDLFGPHFAANAFISEPVHNLVHREVMTQAGATFSSRRAADEETSEFLSSSDSWFRPTMIRTGPDGALWIADMYRLVIEHPQWIPLDWQKKLDLRAGHDRGRIYRVYPVRNPPRKIPRLDSLPPEQLVAALQSPNGWTRDTAQELLVENFRVSDAAGKKKFGDLLQPLLNMAKTSASPQARAQAWATLDGLGLIQTGYLPRGLRDPHPGVRRNVIRIAESSAKLSDQEWQSLEVAARTDDVDVRLQLAFTLGQRSEPRAAELLGEILSTEKDRWVLAAAMSSLRKENIAAVLNHVLTARGRESPNVNLLEILLAQAAAFGNEQAVDALLAEVGKPDGDGRYADWQYRAVGRFLGLRRKEAETSKKLLAAVIAAARAEARDEGSDDDRRTAAIPLLGRDPEGRADDLKTLHSLLTPQNTLAVQTTALETLAHLDGPEIPGLLLEHWSSLTPSLRNQLLDSLLSQEAWVPPLLEAIASKQVLPQDVDAVRRQRLLTHSSADVRDRAAKLFAGSVSTDRAKVLDQFRPAESLAGNIDRGKLVFTKICAQCHKVAGMGFEVGPDLASLTDKSPGSLLVAILDPNRAVEAKFLNYLALTKAGKQHDGLLAAEAGESLTLRGPEARDTVLFRDELDELKGSGKSMMPEGLEKDLKPQDLADLIAFVRGNVPLPKPKTFAGNTPAIIRLEKDGSLVLSAATAEIYGPTLVFEDKYTNLGYWSSADDHATWEIEVDKPGEYTVTLDAACPDENAGGLVQITVAGSTLTPRVESTKSWDVYKPLPAGKLTLPAGRHRLTVRSEGPIRGALLDLKGVRLVMTK